MESYIGINGITLPEQACFARCGFDAFPSRRLMIGTLVTWKSLRRIPLSWRWASQAVKPELLRRVCLADPSMLNVAHFSSEEGQEETVLTDLLRIHELGGPHFHGIQVNIAWPDAALLLAYREQVGASSRLILQLGQKAVKLCGDDPLVVANRLMPYRGFITDILLDPSGGLGQPFDTERARIFLHAIAAKDLGIGLGVAGGLGPDTLHLVEPLLKEFPQLNFDAQGALRTNNEFDPLKTALFLFRASALVK